MKRAPEVQIEIDDVYACPGHCPGCVLTPLERKGQEADMSDEVRKAIFRQLEAYLPQLEGVERMNLNYGIADHLLMTTEYLKQIVCEAQAFFKKVGLEGRGAIFLSTSLIGKSHVIEEKMEALRVLNAESQTKLSFIVVLDPAKLKHKSFGENYKQHVRWAKEKFGEVDLAINLSQAALAELSPVELVDFAKSYDFDEVTINWTPTLDNIEATYSKVFMSDLGKWLELFAVESEAKGLACSYVPVIKRAYDAWQCSLDGRSEGGWMDTMNALLPETLMKSLQFNHEGRVFPKWEAIGDVPHNERFGFQDWGSVLEQDLSDLVASGLRKSMKNVVKTLNKSSACTHCEFAGFCATTGFHVYTHVLNENKVSDADCPHVAKRLIRFLEAPKV